MSSKRLLVALCFVIAIAVLAGCGNSQDQSSAESVWQGYGEKLDVSQAGQNAVAIQDVGKKTIMSEDGRLDLLVLANKDHKISETWEERLDLVEIKNSRGETVTLDSLAADAFKELQKDLERNESIVLEPKTGFRSVADQKRIWDEYMAEYGEDYVLEHVAKPGYSDHQTGLALDTYLADDESTKLTDDETGTNQSTWNVVHSYLAKHGFILRYPYDMEYVTGYMYEPWHFRYVGTKAAKAIMGQDSTLEEYLSQE